MTTEERARTADTVIERALLRDKADLSDKAIEFLMDSARQMIEYKSHIAGEALDVRDLIGALKRSEIGELVYARPEQDDRPDHAAEIAGMNPQQRMNYARKHGLV